LRDYSTVMKSATNFLLSSNGPTGLPAENVRIQTTAREKHLIHGVVQNVRPKNLLRQELYFITANSRSVKPSILPIMFVKGKRTCQPMSMPEGWH